MKDGIKQIIGKTIERVVVAQSSVAPKQQVFLLFSDGTHFELYGEQFTCGAGLDEGGMDRVRGYVHGSGGTLDLVHPEEVPPEFELEDDDWGVVDVARNVARLLLENLAEGDKRAVAIKRAINGLDRLPEVTPGLFIEFGVGLHQETEDYRETKWIDFTVSDCNLGASAGGSGGLKTVGPDGYSDFKWTVELDGYRKLDGDYWYLEDQVSEFLNLGAKISAEDELDDEHEDDE